MDINVDEEYGDRVAPQGYRYPFGQVVYYELVEKAEKQRALMARIALSLGGFAKEYPVDIDDLFPWLSWTNYQATLALMSARYDARLYWDALEIQQLMRWAEDRF